MAGTIKVTLPGGEVVDAVPVDIVETTERWSDAKLSDGSVVRIKLALISVSRTPLFDQQGNPVYNFNFTPVLAVAEVPAHLKRKPN
jgi:hypothetical protein